MGLLATARNTLLAAAHRYFNWLAEKLSQIKCQNSMLDAMGDGVSIGG
jgi:hypothetical protein